MKPLSLFIFGAASVVSTLAADLTSARPRAPARSAATILITDVPHIKQKPDFCGEACAAMMLRKLGAETDQDAIFNLTGVDPALGRGAYTAELAQALKQVGFKTGPVWHQVRSRSATRELNTLWGELLKDLKRGVASIVCMRYDTHPETTEPVSYTHLTLPTICSV